MTDVNRFTPSDATAAADTVKTAAAEKTKQAKEAVAKAEAEAAKAAPWSCDVCANENDAGKPICEMCTAPRPGHGPGPAALRVAYVLSSPELCALTYWLWGSVMTLLYPASSFVLSSAVMSLPNRCPTTPLASAHPGTRMSALPTRRIPVSMACCIID